MVAVFQYMRLLGYAASRIAILTTYNGQKALLKDVLRKRCAPYPIFGEPARVETVDKFQGQQADFVLLSLVRTRAVGHLRDVRRLVVAASRARLGLYVFGRAALFASCYELAPFFAQLAAVSGGATRLRLVPGERTPTARLAGGAGGGGGDVVEVVEVAHAGAIVASLLAALAMPPPPPAGGGEGGGAALPAEGDAVDNAVRDDDVEGEAE